MKKVTFLTIYKKIRGPGVKPTVIIKNKKIYTRKDKSNARQTSLDRISQMQDLLVFDTRQI